MPDRNKRSPLYRLIRWIVHRVGQFLGTAEQLGLPPGTLEGASDEATLWSIPPTGAGMVACWWICHSRASSDLIISAISLAQLREDLATQKGHHYQRNSDPVRFSGKSEFSQQLEAYLSPYGVDPRHVTHIFTVSWRSRLLTNQGGDRRSYAVRSIASIPGDFVGTSFLSSSENRAITRITEAIARRLLKLPEPWEKRINEIDWLDLLEYCAKEVLGRTHVLQQRR